MRYINERFKIYVLPFDISLLKEIQENIKWISNSFRIVKIRSTCLCYC